MIWLLTFTTAVLFVLVWGAFSRLYRLQQRVEDHNFGQFNIECPDPSEHFHFEIGKKKS